MTILKRTLRYDEIEKHRNFNCPIYYKCLDKAIGMIIEKPDVTQNNSSFSCMDCSLKERREDARIRM